ncbi:MAG: hypothetical protein HYZ53_08710 [Planctomycetes bacterium]|nr:hypothetical protein [Planctomycetota bacterium]
MHPPTAPSKRDRLKSCFRLLLAAALLTVLCGLWPGLRPTAPDSTTARTPPAKRVTARVGERSLREEPSERGSGRDAQMPTAGPTNPAAGATVAASTAPAGLDLRAAAAFPFPDCAKLTAFANRTAHRLWGGEPALVSAREIVGPGGAISSRLYIFSLGPSAFDREEVLRKLAEGVNPREWDDGIRCLELGASLEQPPLIAHWTGLPLDLLCHANALSRLRTEQGEREYRFVRAHVSAAFPILEFQSGEETYYYDPTANSTSRTFELRMREEVRRSEKYQKKLDGFRAQWEALSRS